MKIGQHEYIECACSSDEHRFTLLYLPPMLGDGPDLYLTVYLDNRGPLWRKFWRAAKYIFGVRRFSDFSDTVIERNEAVRFRDMLTKFITACDQHDAARKQEQPR